MITIASNYNDKKLAQTLYPKFELFARTCKNGLSEIYPINSRSVQDPEGWKFGSAFPPSYFAFGRMRSAIALQEALALRPKRVLEIAAGGGGLSAALSNTEREIFVNDLRADVLEESFSNYATTGLVHLIAGILFELDPDC